MKNSNDTVGDHINKLKIVINKQEIMNIIKPPIPLDKSLKFMHYLPLINFAV